MNNLVLDNHFSVDWGGSRIDFTEVYGLTFQREVVEFRDGADPSKTARKLPGPMHFQNIVLRRHLKTGDLEMYEWWHQQEVGATTRDVTIKLLDNQHQPIFAWTLSNAFPVRVAYTPLSAQHAQPMMEEIELTFERMMLQAM